MGTSSHRAADAAYHGRALPCRCTPSGAHDDRSLHDSRVPSPVRPGRCAGRLRRRVRAGARRGLGEPVVRPGHLALVVGPCRAGRHRRPARVAGCPGPLHGPDRRTRGLRRRDRVGRIRDGDRGRHGRQQPRPGRAASDLRIAGRLPGAAHPRLDRSGLRVGHDGRPRSADESDDHRVEVGHDDRAERLPGGRLDPSRGGHGGPQAQPLLRQRRRHDRGHHRSGQERRGAGPLGRLPRGLPEPTRHRRSLLGADVRRTGAGVAHRPRSGCPPRLGHHHAWRVPPAGPERQPRRLARSRHRDPGGRRSRQADIPHRRRDRELRRMAGAAHRREHRQTRCGDRADRPGAARRRRLIRLGSGVRAHRPDGRHGRLPRVPSPRRWPRPDTRSSASR